MAEILTSVAGTEIYTRRLQQPKEALAQSVLVGLDFIHDLRAQRAGPKAEINDLDMELGELQDLIHRLVKGDACRWDA